MGKLVAVAIAAAALVGAAATEAQAASSPKLEGTFPGLEGCGHVGRDRPSLAMPGRRRNKL
jgi:hypothetical protein